MTGNIASTTTVAMNQQLNPVTILGGMTQNSATENQFDALVAKVEHRFSKGFAVILHLVKLFEDTSLNGQEILGRHIEHKLGGEDRPFRILRSGGCPSDAALLLVDYAGLG